MSIKRALVVDDSKVARSLLAKMLEKHGVMVDTTESAEAALDYLVTHKPDVIFLDHIMPGMDGFQAMRAIKQNPQTATIPIMMYTSKEGEFYVSQARALGAVGCLPKQVQQADVQEVLDRLGRMHLPAENEFGRAAVNDDYPPASVAPASTAHTDPLHARVSDAVRPVESEALQVALKKYLDEQRTALRQDIEIGFEKAARAVVSDLSHEHKPAGLVGGPPMRPWDALSNLGSGRLVLLGAVLLLPILVLLKLYSDADASREQLARQYQRLVDRQEGLQETVQRNRMSQDNLGDRYQNLLESYEQQQAQVTRERSKMLDMVAWAINQSSALDYGQGLLDGDNMDSIRGLLGQLKAIGFKGVLQIKYHQGRFCLMGNDMIGYSKPPDSTPIGECTIVQNSGVWSATDPMILEQMLNNELTQRGSGIRIQVQSMGTDQPRTIYPHPSAVQTAGEWNRIARNNNRLEVAFVPEPGANN